MAISKLKPRHASEGRSIAAVLKDRLDYDKNPEKTDGGLLVTGYQCSPDTAWQEFAVSKQIYTATTGRKRAPDQDVISYRKTKAADKPAFRAAHETDLLLHEAAKRAFDAQGVKKLPTVRFTVISANASAPSSVWVIMPI